MLPPVPDLVDCSDADACSSSTTSPTPARRCASCATFCEGKVAEVRTAVLYEKPHSVVQLRLRVAPHRPLDQLPVERGRAGAPVKVFIVSDMEGVAGIVKWQQSTRRRDALPRGPRALHRGDQRGGARRKSGGRDGDRRHGLPRRGRRLDVQLARSRPARSRLRVRRAERLDGVHGDAGAGLRRGTLRRHARKGGNAGRRAVAHGLGPGVAGPAVQRRLVGETGINAALCGHGAARSCSSPATRRSCTEATELLGDGLTTVAVKEGLGRFSARQKTPLKARELIEDGAKRALKDLSRRAAVRPGRPVPRSSRVHHARPPRRVPQPPRNGTGRRPDARVEGGRLVVGLVAVLLLTHARSGSHSRHHVRHRAVAGVAT